MVELVPDCLSMSDGRVVETPRAARCEGRTKLQRGDPLSAAQALVIFADWFATILAATISQAAVARYTKTSHTPPNFSWSSCMKPARYEPQPLMTAVDDRSPPL